MFHDFEIDACPAFGWTGGPTASVRIIALSNRHERRNRRGLLMQHVYTLPFQNIPSADYLEEIKAAYMVFGGPADSFLCRDYWDHEVVQSPIGTGDGSTDTFQLTKRYTAGSAFYDRIITKPVAVTAFVDGVEASSTFDATTGMLTLGDAPEEDAPITWSGEFRVPVRFNDFQLTPSIDDRFGAGDFAMNGSCSLIEVFGE